MHSVKNFPKDNFFFYLTIIILSNNFEGNMSEPVIAQKSPYQVKLTAGTYYWCACGESKRQPFCDGSHKAKGAFTPVRFDLNEDKVVWLCACKSTSNSPFCDGTHKKL